MVAAVSSAAAENPPREKQVCYGTVMVDGFGHSGAQYLRQFAHTFNHLAQRTRSQR
jgi:hypothetical protein